MANPTPTVAPEGEVLALLTTLDTFARAQVFPGELCARAAATIRSARAEGAREQREADEVERRDHRVLLCAALDLFDNRLGWSDGLNPYAPPYFWANLGAAIYGDDDPRVVELRALTPPDGGAR